MWHTLYFCRLKHDEAVLHVYNLSHFFTCAYRNASPLAFLADDFALDTRNSYEHSVSSRFERTTMTGREQSPSYQRPQSAGTAAGSPMSVNKHNLRQGMGSAHHSQNAASSFSSTSPTFPISRHETANPLPSLALAATGPMPTRAQAGMSPTLRTGSSSALLMDLLQPREKPEDKQPDESGSLLFDLD